MPDNTQDKSVSVSAFELPTSHFLGAETRRALQQSMPDLITLGEQIAQSCPPMESATIEEMPEIRQQQADVFYQSAIYKKLTDRYRTSMQPQTHAGVYTEVFTPAEGVPLENQQRVLINFHGGSFTAGARTQSHQESIPIAATGKIKVVSVDYRMGPEHRFPAATDDALAVYQTLLKDYQAKNIGLYGCSSGAMLCAQLLARLQTEELPMPGAVAMSSWAAHDIDGDSNHTVAAQIGMAPYELSNMSYFEGVDKTDPLVIPGSSKAVLAQFPPSLLMTSTRDFLMSTVIHTHAQLVSLGVEAQLHVWDGLDHAFIVNPEITESREAYELMVKFFDKHLDSKAQSKR